jgi:RHS repeat-associated protein
VRAINAQNTTMDLRFPGQWFQLETGLHYNWHRHYDPTTGRYLQPDPLGFVDGPGIFGYAKQSPLTKFDPFGLYGTQSCQFWQQACTVGGNNSTYACTIALSKWKVARLFAAVFTGQL